MNHKRLIPILAAVLAVLMLAGCGVGRESVQDNSTPEGLQTFGVAVNPSAQPSMAQEVSPNVTMPDGSTVTTMPQGPVTPTIKHRDSRWAVSIAERRKRRINRAA